MKPTQSSFYFKNLPTGKAFEREFQTQTTLPMDGSNASLRTYSPFIIRMLPPTILGDVDTNVLTSGVNPQRGPGYGGTILESNRDLVNYSATVRGVSVAPPSQVSYAAMVAAGKGIPGLTTTTTASIRDRYNQALNAQVFGPTVQRSLNGTRSNPTATITPALSNDLSALSILLQVKQLMSVPPLLLLINPQSMSTTHTKIAQFQERSRKGYIYQAWGEELVKISFTFKIGAYAVGSGGSRKPSGIQRASRLDSASFQQLQTLLSMFQSNGYIQDVVGHSKAHLMVGNIAIEYDQNVYVGHFDTFSMTEEEGQQNGGLQFDMEFTAIKVFDLAQPTTSVSPLSSPANPLNNQRGTGRGTIQRSGSTSGIQVITAPTIGIQGSNVPPQPWAGSTVTDQGVVTPPNVLNSRRGR